MPHCELIKRFRLVGWPRFFPPCFDGSPKIQSWGIDCCHRDPSQTMSLPPHHSSDGKLGKNHNDVNYTDMQ